MDPGDFARDMRRAADEVPRRLQEVSERFAEETADVARGNVPGRVPGKRASRRPSNEGSLSRTRASIRGEGTATGGRIGIGGPSAPGALGHEFGGGGTPRSRQFGAFKGKEGYFLFPTIRSRLKDDTPWERIVDDVLGRD